jgi:hypothetical protein
MTLHELITNKGFDAIQAALTAQFASGHIEYAYRYNDGTVPSITVWLNYGNIPATITIAEDATMSLTYFENGRNNVQKFKNCTAADFNTMIEYAVNYLANSNFDLHEAWHSGLDKAQ